MVERRLPTLFSYRARRALRAVSGYQPCELRYQAMAYALAVLGRPGPGALSLTEPLRAPCYDEFS